MMTVACVWVKANVPYSLTYVARLQAMVEKHLHRPHRFVCLTDRPERMPRKVDPIRIAPYRGLAGWWAKVELFNPAHQLSGVCLYLDLDTLVVDALDPIADYGAAFALVPDAGTFRPRNGLQVVKRFNSSVMRWVAGVSDGGLYARWSPDVAGRLWGDQDWLGEVLTHGETMPAAWFPRLSAIGATGPGPDAKVVLCKVPKNDEAAQRWPWVDAAWRAA